MKRILFIILTLSYLIFSTGMISIKMLCLELNKNTEPIVLADNQKYCSKCSKCVICLSGSMTQEEAEAEAGCCKDNTEFVKVNIDQSLAKTEVKLNTEQYIVLQNVLPFLGLEITNTIDQADLAFYNSSPPQTAVPINVLHCVYRI